MWSVLFLTLPTQPSAVRLRDLARAEDAGLRIACVTVSTVLPDAQAALFDPLAAEVRLHGGQAIVLELSTRDEVQRAEVLALFDRTEAYAPVARDGARARPRR